MKRNLPIYVIALLFTASALLAAGWSEAWDQVNPPIPMAGLYAPGVGRCVALYEGDELIGITINRTEDMHKANRNRASYAISTYNALARIAQEAHRPEIASWATGLRMTDGPDPMQDEGTITCWCENTIWQRDERGNKLIPKGCGGPCGSCSHCVVVYPAIN